MGKLRSLLNKGSPHPFFPSVSRRTSRRRIGTNILSEACITSLRRSICYMTSGELPRKESWREKLSRLSMSGEGVAIFFVFIKRFMWDYVCKKLDFATYTRTSPEWLRAPLFGSADFFPSVSALPHMPTTFSRRELFKSVWTSLLTQRV